MRLKFIIAATLGAALIGMAGFGEIEAAPESKTDRADEWSVEVVERKTSTQLRRLGQWMAAHLLGTARKAQGLALFRSAESFAAVPLPSDLEGIPSDPGEADPANLDAKLLRWIPGKDGTLETHFKTIAVESVGETSWTTRVRGEWILLDSPSTHQRIADWRIVWAVDAILPPRIESIEVLSTHRVDSPKPMFLEATEQALGPLAADPRLVYGGESWFGWSDALGELNLMGHNGIAVGDVNGDGQEDLYVGLGTGHPNLLLIRQPDGTVADSADAAGVAWLDDTKGVLLVDTDGDGDRDLVCAIGPSLVLAKNDGAGKFGPFVQLKAQTSAPFYSLAAADYDLDGDLDLYGVRYVEQSYGVSVPIPFHDANNGPSNHLFRNDGRDRFVDVTKAIGLDANNRRFSLAAAWEDYDDDGDPDLYVTNDFGRNNLYRNDGGRFTDVARAAGIEDQAAGMGVSCADVDGDGRFDLHVSNMFSSAGRRITGSDAFLPDDPEARAAARGLSLGNSLFLADGDGGFRDVADDAGIRMGRWAWGALFADLENDGDPDLVVPNGFLTGILEDDL